MKDIYEGKAVVQRDLNQWYHSQMDYINASSLKTIFQKSPFHYFYAEPKVPTAAMLFGTAYHDYVLEENTFTDRYWCFDDSKRPNKDKDFRDAVNKQWKAEEEAKAKGKTILTLEAWQQILTMKKVLMDNPNIAGFLMNGESELSHYHQDFNGVKARIRPDYLKPKVVVDLKTCSDASPEGFSRQAHNMGYHIQAALYSDVLEDIYQTPRKFVFICQETTYPFAAQAYAASDAFLNQGRYEYTIALELYKKCLESGEWPGYEMRAEPEMRGLLELDLPHWAYKESKVTI